MMDLIVIVLLCSPVEIPVPVRIPNSLWWHVLDLSQRLELIGPEESCGHNFVADFKLLRLRIKELAYCPPSSDRYRFPLPADVYNYQVGLHNYRAYLSVNLYKYHHGEYYRTEINRVDRLYNLWSTLHEAVGYTTIYYRRKALKVLKEQLGEADYYSGTLPYALPLDKSNP